ncbi:hypothetical protein [Wolbachia endosymbiont (group A) of Anomoia purmunda]|uniref:hypothetical protein n=1 Tax=Wolbachia endosymbiont (group A) of Anomoia purmunda TaxID=2953978 RepID=UPI00222FDFD6|nr:hypothetical protein [Wolbachia endosymbiont (group A) of Anomoia purmunda]
MWKSIKKFFKWIADHTGISWVARKISSGWKCLFGGKANATQQSTSQQEKSSGNERQEPSQAQSKSTTTPKTLDNEVNPDQPVSSVASGNNSVSSSQPILISSNTNSQEPVANESETVGKIKFLGNQFTIFFNESLEYKKEEMV